MCLLLVNDTVWGIMRLKVKDESELKVEIDKLPLLSDISLKKKKFYLKHFGQQTCSGISCKLKT